MRELPVGEDEDAALPPVLQQLQQDLQLQLQQQQQDLLQLHQQQQKQQQQQPALADRVATELLPPMLLKASYEGVLGFRV